MLCLDNFWSADVPFIIQGSRGRFLTIRNHKPTARLGQSKKENAGTDDSNRKHHSLQVHQWDIPPQ